MTLIKSGRTAYVVLGIDVPIGVSEAQIQSVIMGGVTMTLDVRAHHRATLIHFAPEGWLEAVLATAIKAQATVTKQ